MHRRGVVLLLGFVLTVVVVGGSGVRAPWTPAGEHITTPSGPRVAAPGVAAPRVAYTMTRLRVE